MLNYEVSSLASEEFFDATSVIYDNLEAAFTDHRKKLDQLRSKRWKFAGQDIGSWVVAGSIEVAAAVFGTPAWGLASTAISQITDAPKLKEIPGKFRSLREEGRTISKSAAGLLFKHRPN